MTPNRKVSFSRVRTIFADCQDAAREVIRCDTYSISLSVIGPQCDGVYATHLQLELLHLALGIVREDLTGRRLESVHKIFLEHLLEGLVCSEFETVTVFRKVALEKVDSGVEIGFHGVYKGMLLRCARSLG